MVRVVSVVRVNGVVGEEEEPRRPVNLLLTSPSSSSSWLTAGSLRVHLSLVRTFFLLRSFLWALLFRFFLWASLLWRDCYPPFGSNPPEPFAAAASSFSFSFFIMFAGGFTIVNLKVRTLLP